MWQEAKADALVLFKWTQITRPNPELGSCYWKQPFLDAFESSIFSSNIWILRDLTRLRFSLGWHNRRKDCFYLFLLFFRENTTFASVLRTRPHLNWQFRFFSHWKPKNLHLYGENCKCQVSKLWRRPTMTGSRNSSVTFQLFFGLISATPKLLREFKVAKVKNGQFKVLKIL